MMIVVSVEEPVIWIIGVEIEWYSLSESNHCGIYDRAVQSLQVAVEICELDHIAPVLHNEKVLM